MTKNIIKTFLCYILCINIMCGCVYKFPVGIRQTIPKSTADSPSGENSGDSAPILQETPSPVKTLAPAVKETEPPASEEPEPTETAVAPTPQTAESAPAPAADKNIIIVLDPGHGKSSSLMSDDEKIRSGYTFVQGRGWGEWRHFKSGTMWQDCEGYGCNGRAPAGGSCWYPIGASNRDTEPELNYNNAINAKKYLEQMGYTVRLTRSENESPSITQRIKKCYPNGDTSLPPDAAAYVCLHSNAGGGSGSCYISLSGLYDQRGIPENYIAAGNALGKSINERIVQNTSLQAYCNGKYTGYPELILFFKSPVPVAYMEIGFYDRQSDLAILRSESDMIGKAIAEGIDEYYR